MNPTIVKIVIVILLLGIVLVVALNWQRIFFGRDSVPLEGSLVHYESFSSEFVEERPVDVWLPDGYDPESSDRYAVIYMHDGQFLFDHPTSPYFGTVWMWDVDKAMTRLISEQQIRPAIVVSIWNLPKTRRRTEYMPQKPVTEEAARALKAEGSDVTREAISSDNYLRFLVEELKPFIDKTYRTYPDKDNTFIIGSSMGGMISAYAIAEYPDVFGGAACMSTHFSMGGGVVIDWYEERWPMAGSNRVYFDYGTETLDADYEPFQLRMDEVMREKGFQDGVDWMTRKFDGADHTPRAWRERLHVPLVFLLGSD